VPLFAPAGAFSALGATTRHARAILRSRVACVLHDRINLAIQDLEAAIVEVEREV
jgi:hypothetical protein